MRIRAVSAYPRFEDPKDIYRWIYNEIRPHLIEADKQADEAGKWKAITAEIKPILLDVRPMRDFILYLLNNGEMTEMAAHWAQAPVTLPITARQADKDETTFSFVERFRDRAEITETGFRMQHSHALTESEYSNALKQAGSTPLIVRTMALMQDIMGRYLEGMGLDLMSALRREHFVNPMLDKAMQSMFGMICNAASKTFTEELLPFLLLAEKKPDDPAAKKTFMEGFRNALLDQAFIVQNGRDGSELECPFKSGSFQLWGTNYQQADGKYILNPAIKPSALPILLHSFLQNAAHGSQPRPSKPDLRFSE